MKIKNLAITILMTTFFIIIGTKAYATTGIINVETAKLRKAPDSKTVLDLLDEGDEVEILEKLDGWYKVKATTELGKVTGYVSEELIKVKEDIADKMQETEAQNKVEENTNAQETENDEVISSDVIIDKTGTSTSNEIKENNQYTLEQEVSAKILPLINSKEKTKIIGNIIVKEIINDWVRIESDSNYGWIRKNALKNSITKAEEPVQEQPNQQPEEDIPEETITEEPEKPEEIELKKVGYVNAEGLRVRKGPSTDTEELHSLSKNNKVEIIGQTGNWYKINLDGEIGYVSAKYISDTKLPETTSRSGSTLKNENVSREEEKNKVEEVPVTSISSTTGTAIVEYAKQYLGYKYVSGGASPSTGFDCSGFTQYVYKHFGISLNRTSLDQINNGVAIDKKNLQPGDLVLFNNDANTKIGHVGIYIGDGNFIHASNPSDGVKITTLTTGYYHKRYVGARRVF